jgi:hypothetical protein
MKWLAAVIPLLLSVLVTGPAAAQSRMGDKPCNVERVDSAHYGALVLYRDCEVDRPAKVKKDAQPSFRFPQQLRCAFVEMEFAVDSTGIVIDSTVRVIESNNSDFASITRRSLPRWRYEPAMKGGVAVRQVVRERVARADNRVVFVVVRPGELPPKAAPELPCV